MVDTPGRITLWGIEVLVATAEEGSISAAARKLGASASSVSQQLTNLEQALGVALLDRGARPVVLTQAGELFRRRALNILDEADQARAELATLDPSSLIRFRLGIIEDFDADVTPHLLTRMAHELSNCRFLLETGASHRLFDLLESRTLDVIVAADTGAAADWLETHPLMREPFVAAVPRGAGGGANLLKERGALPLIQYTARHMMGRQIGAHLAQRNLHPSHRFELDSYHAILAMVASGAGWTILTPLGVLSARRFLDRVDLHPLPVDPLSRTISLYARREVLGRMPADVAGHLKELIQELVIDRAREAMPWLGDEPHLL